jgi:MOSC domain-containing protein YiiM
VPSVRRVRGGRIAGLYVGSGKGKAKKPVSHLSLSLDGVQGDAHSGRSRAAGPREPAFRRNTTIANTRQLSLVSVEELHEIAEKLGIPPINPGWLAANIATDGFGPITQLPPGTIIRATSGASIYISELNSPCRVAAELLCKHGSYSGDATTFVKHAKGRRGLVGFVYSSGVLLVGDELELLKPVVEPAG